ncbi:hypothetical protein HPP92_012720 [Vanilla planifolia]|uniref:Alpha/beta hydrolase fold-3 domain-containing protein n=1 Tax=Vanilla planifolia TaxID=51239 RepID=A0A835UZY2_VANPL|nr:hypothetical protein HPP92_012720 [Vanilla planifolia]
MMTLGTNDATIAPSFIDGFTLDGPIAHVARKVVYLLRMPTDEHRLKVGMSWLTNVKWKVTSMRMSDLKNFLWEDTSRIKWRTKSSLICLPVPSIQVRPAGAPRRTVVADAAPVDDATGVTARRVVIDPSTPLHACLYLPPDPSPNLPILVYFHGGAFCIGSAFSPTYHPHLIALSASARLLVASVDYRLAPEHPLPAAYDDCWAALLWTISPQADPWIRLHGDQGRIFLAGDSAGATSRTAWR